MIIKETLEFILNCDIDRIEPDFTKVVYVGEKTRLEAFSMSRHVTPIQSNRELANIVVFALLDAVVDLREPKLEGKYLRNKYDGMRKTTEIEKIFREVFRIYIVIRNASVHAQSKIQHTNELTEIAYDHGKTKFKLNYSTLGNKHLNSLIIMFAKSGLKMDNYLMEFARYHYHALLKEISVFNDDIDVLLDNSIPATLLTSTSRVRVYEPNYQELGSEYQIERYEKQNTSPTDIRDEYFLYIHEMNCIIPGEALDHKGCIKRDDIKRWVVGDTNYLCP